MFEDNAETSFCSQHRNRNSTRRKVFRTNRVAARHAEETANSNAMVTVPAPERIARYLRQFVLPVVRKQPYRSSPAATDLYIAGTVTRLNAVATKVETEGRVR